LSRDVPQLRSSLDESRKVVDKTREALALALKQQDKLEPLLKDIPLKAALLAEQLPALGSDLAQVLRGTERLKELAVALRQAQTGIHAVGAHWPESRRALARSATMLRATRNHLKDVLKNRAQYENAKHQAVLVAESLALMLPMV